MFVIISFVVHSLFGYYAWCWHVQCTEMRMALDYHQHDNDDHNGCDQESSPTKDVQRFQNFQKWSDRFGFASEKHRVVRICWAAVVNKVQPLVVNGQLTNSHLDFFSYNLSNQSTPTAIGIGAPASWNNDLRPEPEVPIMSLKLMSGLQRLSKLTWPLTGQCQHQCHLVAF